MLTYTIKIDLNYYNVTVNHYAVQMEPESTKASPSLQNHTFH